MSLSEFFLNSKSTEVLLETYEISHPDFTRTYYLVKNHTSGITATTENSDVIDFEYVPMSTTRLVSSDTLDSSIEISIGDQGDYIAAEVDAVREANGMTVKPKVIYRGYTSSDLSQPLEGPYIFDLTNCARSREGAGFDAAPVDLNIHRTGELYTFERFPMLRGFL